MEILAHERINNKEYKIEGTIMMGMIAILVDDTVKVGDEVTVIGNNIKKEAAITHVIPYILMTGINANIPRVYIKNGTVEKEIDSE